MPAAKKKTAKKQVKTEEVKAFERGDDGRIIGFDYPLDDLGRVCWKSLIPKEHLALNRESLLRKDIDPSKLTDEEKENIGEEDTIVLLQGFKDLAEIRGYLHYEESLEYFPSKVEKAIATCKICWAPDPETGGLDRLVTTVGEAHNANTNDFGQK